jgi:hypothetical protein
MQSFSKINKYSFEDLKILKRWYGIMYTKELATLLGRSKYSVHKKAEKLGLRSSIKSRNTYFHDKIFFKKLNVTSCYWAGFLAADGSINVTRNSIELTLQRQDKNHLAQFKKDIKFTGIIRDYSKKNVTWKGLIIKSKNGISRININSAKNLIKDLKNNFNITSKKSHTLKPPKLKFKNHIKAFIKGYIDGDGCINADSWGKLSFYIIGTTEICMWVKKFYEKTYKINKNRLISHDSRNIVYYKISGETALKVLQDLKKVPTPELSRKWKEIEKYRKKALEAIVL